ncbi:uncharacterized protein CDAR_515681 [Caerostris darwini]|uniref:Uncharacterized protein n=1 Tax=Caerostris darwini TaxID=1538125 RepID=A0AAV4S1F6_9ARAC|nr:uncharacterized protein CDAR_515681 [Caerostris darwini]
MLVEPFENGLDFVPDIANGLIEEDVVEECPTNPFFEEETNPFRINGESKNPFIKSSNPFEKENSEITPALQPKGQISAAVKAPPIPERLQLQSQHHVNDCAAAVRDDIGIRKWHLNYLDGEGSMEAPALDVVM